MVYVGTKDLLKSVPVNKVREFEGEYLSYLKAKHSDTLEALKNGKYTDAETGVLESAAAEITARYS